MAAGDFTFGTPSIFDSSQVFYPVLDKVDDNKFSISWADNSFAMKTVIGENTNLSPTYGVKQTLTTSGQFNISAANINTTSFINVFEDRTTITQTLAQIASVSGNTITLNTSVVVEGLNPVSIQVVAMSDTTGVIATNPLSSGNLNLYPYSISGTVITIHSPTTHSTGAGNFGQIRNGHGICKIDADRFAVVLSNTNSGGRAECLVGQLAANSITLGNLDVFDFGNTSEISVVATGIDTFVATYILGSGTYSCVFDVIGLNPQGATPQVIPSPVFNPSQVDVVYVSDGLVCITQFQSQQIVQNLAYVTGSTLTHYPYSAKNLGGTAVSSTLSSQLISEDVVAVAYKDEPNSGYGGLLLSSVELPQNSFSYSTSGALVVDATSTSKLIPKFTHSSFGNLLVSGASTNSYRTRYIYSTSGLLNLQGSAITVFEPEIEYLGRQVRASSVLVENIFGNSSIR